MWSDEGYELVVGLAVAHKTQSFQIWTHWTEIAACSKGFEKSTVQKASEFLFGLVHVCPCPYSVLNSVFFLDYSDIVNNVAVTQSFRIPLLIGAGALDLNASVCSTCFQKGFYFFKFRLVFVFCCIILMLDFSLVSFTKVLFVKFSQGRFRFLEEQQTQPELTDLS